jgi:hypothetical protein
VFLPSLAIIVYKLKIEGSDMLIDLRGVLVSALLLCVPAAVLAQNSTASKGVSAEERAVLIALYDATGGPHWANRSGWLGVSGTECEWHGVACVGDAQATVVGSLHLSENNLVGTIPAELGQLKSLEWLSLVGNRLDGTLPDVLIQRWLSGPLYIAAEAHLLTNISQIEYEWIPNSVLCPTLSIILRSDGRAVVYKTVCRDATPEDRVTYCEVKEGKIRWDEFARMSWLIEKAGFFTMEPKYTRNVDHGVFENTRVTRAGKTVEVSNFTDAGPFQLWGIARAIEGVATEMEVQKSSRRATCPTR